MNMPSIARRPGHGARILLAKMLTFLGWIGVGVLAWTLSMEPLAAQPPGRDHGGMRGGPPGARRGPPGMRGGPTSGPSSFIARMDTNGNGMLDPNETQGRAREFLERIGLDPSRPIPLDAVNRAFEEMRSRRMREMGTSSRGNDRGRDRGDRSGRDRGGRSSSAQPDYEPLVPGFGEPDLFDPVPGFGDTAERFAVKIEESDRREAQRTMGRNDTNRDGVLDAEEIRRGRWSSDALSTDRNRDGKLTVTELSLRYAIRRVEREGGSSKSRSSSRGASSSSSKSSAAAPRDDSREKRMIEMMFGRYDRDRDGKISREEWSGFRPDYDANKDGKISKDEFAKAMASRFGRGRSRGESRDSGRSRFYSRRDSNDQQGHSDASSSRASSTSDSRHSYRSKTPAERLAALEDLPEWFSRTDANADGQVKMSEYAVSWSDEQVADFSQFDLNRDGIITPKECLKATKEGAVRGSPSAAAPTPSDSRSTASSNTRSQHLAGEPTTASAAAEPKKDTPASAAAAARTPPSVGDVPKVYRTYAVNLIKKYDKNRDGVLTKDEWTSMNKDYSYADVDKDGQLSPIELGAAFMKR